MPSPNAETSSESFNPPLEAGFLSAPRILSCPSNPVDVDLDASPEGVSCCPDLPTPRRRHPMRTGVADRNLNGDWTDNYGSDGVNVLPGDAVRFVRRPILTTIRQ